MSQHSLSPALEEQLRALSDGYARKLPEKLAQIGALWMVVRDEAPSSWPVDALSNLHRMVHSLAGSGTTFGFAEVSKYARRAEIVLKPLALAGVAPGAAQKRDLEAALRALEIVAVSPLAPFGADGFDLADASPDSRDIVLLSDAPESVRSWVPAVEAFGYHVQICASARSFQLAVGRACAALIIDTSVEPDALVVDGEPIASLLEPVGAGTLFPLLWTAQSSALSTRLAATRLGGAAFLSQPVDVDDLVGKLDALTASPSPEPFRVLVMDDEPALTRLYSLILRQAGMEVCEVNDPLTIMEPMLAFKPDIVLIDVLMPGVKGTELAAVLRQQDAFGNTPIVFLSVDNDPTAQQSALRSGGDGFLCKPIEPRNLVSAVSIRASRSRSLKQLISNDIVTGLPNHTRLKEQLEIEVARAMRLNHEISFALVDIDHFRHVNECHGYAAGDRMLRALARMLSQHVRQTDVVGRYGGEEFAVILSGAGNANAARRMDEVRAAFASLTHCAGGEEFRATFSCGVSTAPPGSDSSSLCEAAVTALQVAKTQGRNRIASA